MLEIDFGVISVKALFLIEFVWQKIFGIYARRASNYFFRPDELIFLEIYDVAMLIQLC